MAVLRRLQVDGVGQVKILDDHAWAKIEIVPNNFDKLVGGLARSSVRINEDGKRLGNSNGIRQLDHDAAGELGMDERFGDPSSDVRARAINLDKRGSVTASEVPLAIKDHTLE
jgi:hypothetical protein